MADLDPRVFGWTVLNEQSLPFFDLWVANLILKPHQIINNCVEIVGKWGETWVCASAGWANFSEGLRISGGATVVGIRGKEEVFVGYTNNSGEDGGFGDFKHV